MNLVLTVVVIIFLLAVASSMLLGGAAGLVAWTANNLSGLLAFLLVLAIVALIWRLATNNRPL